MSILRKSIPGRRYGWYNEFVVTEDMRCDLYLYVGEDKRGPFVCCCHCPHLPDYGSAEWGRDDLPEVRMRTWRECLAHVHSHRHAGHRFPDWLFEYVEAHLRDEPDGILG